MTESASLPEGGRSVDADVMIVTIRSVRDVATTERLDGFGSRLRTIALVEHRDLRRVADAIRVGVNGVVDRDAAPEAVVDATCAADHGHILLPDWAVAALATRLPAPLPGDQLVSNDEVTWLRLLARGSTVGVLADHAGYSEREMFRNLHDLYERIGAHSRIEALLWADRHALLDAGTVNEDDRT